MFWSCLNCASPRVGFASAAMLLAAVVQMHSELALPQLPGGAAGSIFNCKTRSAKRDRYVFSRLNITSIERSLFFGKTNYDLGV